MLLDKQTWQATFHEFAKSAWRLETLPIYTVPQEKTKLVAFMAGERIPGNYESEWTRKIAEHRRNGRTIGRVHIVNRPLSDYLRFEFMYYQASVRAGEDIRILDVTDRPNPLAGIQDFWIFDDRKVVLMHYDQDGTHTGQEVYEGNPRNYLEYQRVAVAESIPLTDYLSS